MLKEIKYGALSGKARAMFGKLLSKNDYKILIQKKRIAQVVSYLKHNTHYSGLLSDTDENNIHRVKLEILLKKDIINDYSKFFKFTNGRLNEFVKHYCTKAEIESLKLIFRMFEGGNTEHGLLEESLLFLSRHDKLDIPKLSLSRDLEEFLSRLHGTDYYKLLKPFISDNKENRLFNIEMTLDLYYFRNVQWAYQKFLNRNDALIVKDLLEKEADIFNILWIYRSKYFYNMSNEVIKSYMAHINDKLSERSTESLIEAEGYEAYVDIISKTPYGFLFKGQNQLFIEHNYHEYTYKLYKMLFRRKPFSIACMISYLRLKEIEISNIISIIEGIRYNLSESEIGKFIVGMGI